MEHEPTEQDRLDQRSRGLNHEHPEGQANEKNTRAQRDAQGAGAGDHGNAPQETTQDGTA